MSSLGGWYSEIDDSTYIAKVLARNVTKTFSLVWPHFTRGNLSQSRFECQQRFSQKCRPVAQTWCKSQIYLRLKWRFVCFHSSWWQVISLWTPWRCTFHPSSKGQHSATSLHRNFSVARSLSKVSHCCSSVDLKLIWSTVITNDRKCFHTQNAQARTNTNRTVASLSRLSAWDWLVILYLL